MAVTERDRERIGKLLKLHHDQRGTPEGEAAYSTALRICARLSIDIHTLQASFRPDDPTVISEVIEMPSNAVWRATLGWRIADFTNVGVLRHTGGSLQVTGRAPDVVRFKQFFARASAEIDVAGTIYVEENGGGKAAGAAFRKGAANGFATMLREYHEKAQQSENGLITKGLLEGRTTALVLASRATEIEKYYKESLKIKPGHYKDTARGDGRAQKEGFKYGKGMKPHIAEVASVQDK